MNAAVVRNFDGPPVYGPFDDPTPGEGEVMVEVLAAGLSQLTRGQASGRHYSSGQPPFVPGFDGVGRLADGRRVYFAGPIAPYGAMAERTLVRESTTIELPDTLDDVTAAAIANPGMSSSAALTYRARLEPGETVLVLGATGTSGRLAIPIARHLGAGRVVAVGRNRALLEGVGADAILTLDAPEDEIKAALRGVDVVIDYLWGEPAERLMHGLAGSGSSEASPRIRWVQVGSIAGREISFPSEVLRSTGLELLGSGLGSVARRDLVAAIAKVFAMGLSTETEVSPLAEVASAWNRDTGRKRLVFVS